MNHETKTKLQINTYNIFNFDIGDIFFHKIIFNK